MTHKTAVTHKVIIIQGLYDLINNHILLKRDPTFAVGDSFIAQLQGHRDQKEFTITEILTDKVNAHFCYLLLKQVNQDDLKDVNVG